VTCGASGSSSLGSPKLRRLEINVGFDLDDQIMLDMVQSSWRPSTDMLQVESLALVFA
jgi:hypothetical protein